MRYAIVLTITLFSAVACSTEPPNHIDAVNEATRTCHAFKMDTDRTCLLSVYRYNLPKDESSDLIGKEASK